MIIGHDKRHTIVLHKCYIAKCARVGVIGRRGDEIARCQFKYLEWRSNSANNEMSVHLRHSHTGRPCGHREQAIQ